VIAHFSSGTAATNAPTPAVHRQNNKPQPTGTAQTKCKERNSPRLAAKAVDNAVLGPGVKLLTIAKTSSAVHSVGFMD
jgi:hypothetical protein